MHFSSSSCLVLYGTLQNSLVSAVAWRPSWSNQNHRCGRCSICQQVAVLVGRAPTFLTGHPLLSHTTECLTTDDPRQLNQSSLYSMQHHTSQSSWAQLPQCWHLSSLALCYGWMPRDRRCMPTASLIHRSCFLPRCASLSISSTS